MLRPPSAEPQSEAAPAAASGSVSASSAPPAIETVAVRKRYGDRVALHDLTLRVEPGEVFGFLGPNGAGKSTAVKIMAGLVRPTTGTARVLGHTPTDPRARRRLGYLPELFEFQDWATGEELLDFHGKLAGMPGRLRRERIDVVLEQVGLGGRGRDKIGGYSKGMTQRIGLAQALLADPALVLLDEPTSALDPVGRRDVRALIQQISSEGVTVFLNSHLLSEVELVCDRVAIIDRGRVVRSGRLGELMGPVVHVRVDVDRVDEALLSAIDRYGDIADVTATSVTLTVDDAAVAADVGDLVVRKGYRLFALVPVQQSLEDVFVDLVHGETS
jgi:ABC-2 type transport system ATP-binding protein